ncbi:MAG: ABC transporter substrate-binding protein, partial [Oscillospiraceae bacterium]
MKLKKILACLCAGAISLTALASCGAKKDSASDADKNDKTYKIGVVQIMEHESLNIIRDKIVERLGELGYENGKNCDIDLQQANGEATTVQQILDQFKANEDDIIIAITTPCAQLAAEYSEDIPVVFSAVTDPVGANIVKSLDDTGANITGTSDKLNIDKILEFALKVKPDIKKLGFLYNTGED